MNKSAITWLWICIAFVSVIHLLSAEAKAEKKIGVLIFSEEARYIASKNGVMDQLKEDGFGEPAVKYTIENAGGSKVKVMEVIEKFAAAKMDLIITFSTNATLPAMTMITDVPIVFSVVYDPVEAKIANDWKSSGNNTTGTSSRVPMSKLIARLMEIAPVKKLAVLYTPGEKHTEILLKEMQELQAKYQIKVIPVPITKQEEVAQILPGVVRSVDAISLSGSSVYYSSIPMIADMATKAKVVTITHLEDIVEKGAFLGVCSNPYLSGRLAGTKAVKILKGAKPASLPIEYLKEYDLIINMKTVKAGQFQIPPSFMKKVTKTIE